MFVSFNKKNTDMEAITSSYNKLNPFLQKKSTKKLDKEKKINRELTSEEEKTTFLYTGKINSAKIIAKHLI
jgi:hypothetical protein